MQLKSGSCSIYILRTVHGLYYMDYERQLKFNYTSGISIATCDH